jgi:hypothetical protein
MFVLCLLLLPARNLDSYHEVLYKRMDKLLNVTQPRKSVMLAIDGPAPLAKLMTQRERRKVRGEGGGERSLSTWIMQGSMRVLPPALLLCTKPCHLAALRAVLCYILPVPHHTLWYCAVPCAVLLGPPAEILCV